MAAERCACGGEVWIKKRGECKRCYNRNYQRRYTGWPRRRPAKPKPRAVRTPPLGPCTYGAAHQRIKDRRGRAGDHTCQCGQPAQEWSYRGGSATEQRGTRRQLSHGEWREYTVAWSGNPDDYDALCRPCHIERDRGSVFSVA